VTRRGLRLSCVTRRGLRPACVVCYSARPSARLRARMLVLARLTAYDWLLARRTLALGIALAILGFVVMLGTDDATSTVAGRFGRLAALVSLAGGGGAFIATEQARSRGEMRALGAAGVRPTKASLGAIVGGAAVGA